MTTSPLLEVVKAADALEGAKAARDVKIREAVEAGHSHRKVARAARISHQRVGQILSGKETRNS